MGRSSRKKKPKPIGKREKKDLMKAAVTKRWSLTQAQLAENRPLEQVVDQPRSPASEPQPGCSFHSSEHQQEQEVVSRRKLESMAAVMGVDSDSGDSEDQAPQPTSAPRTWRIMEMEQLNKLCRGVICPHCYEPGMTLQQGTNPKGFAEPLYLACMTCPFNSDIIYSSPKLPELGAPFEINSLMTLLTHELGKGYEALQKFKVVLGMNVFSDSTYRKHQARLFSVSRGVTDKYLHAASEFIRAMSNDLGENGIVDLTVSYDGTWQKRGFSSHHGVGVAIEVNTGLVIDTEALSNFCHACSLAKQRLGAKTPAFEAWKAEHMDCDQNFEGSAKAMEAEAARRIWARSLHQYGFRYTCVLGDGDAATIAALQSLNPYGDEHPITKLDCINHAEKRLGTALRKVISEKGLGGRGTGRLTTKKAEKLQRYYGRAVRRNKGDTDAMRREIWGGYFHSISTDENPLHSNCPSGENEGDWCIFNKCKLENKPPPSHGPETISTHLSEDVAEHLIPIYDRMTDPNLLDRMALGATQNPNESFNNLLWMHCPKQVFVGRKRVTNAVDMAVARFNAGVQATSERMRAMGIELSEAQIVCMKAADARRVAKAEKAAEEQSKKVRKARQQAKRRALSQLEETEGPQYEPGGF